MKDLPGFVVVFGLPGVYGDALRVVARRAEVLRLAGFGLRVGGRFVHAVEVVLRLVHGVGLHLRAASDAHLGVGLEGVLDALGHQEAGVDAAVLRGVEGVGRAFLVPPGLAVPLAVLPGGVAGEARPVFLEHDSVVHGVVRSDYLHEAGDDVARAVRQVAGVLHGLAAVVVAEGEAVLLVDNDGVVGVLDLACPGAHHQFAVAGDGQRQAVLVDVVSPFVLADGDAARLQVAEGADARLDGEAADGQVDEGGEDGEAGGLGGGLRVVLQPMVEVDQLAFVGGLALAFAPEGVPNLDELVPDRLVGQDVGGLQLLELVDGQRDVAHKSLIF